MLSWNRYPFFNVTLLPSSLAPPVAFPLPPIQQFAHSLPFRALNDMSRLHLKEGRWGRREEDGGEGALNLVSRRSYLRSPHNSR